MALTLACQCCSHRVTVNCSDIGKSEYNQFGRGVEGVIFL